MNHYERCWYRWLRRQLQAELGIRIRIQTGRPKSLTDEQELAFFREVIATPHKQRSLVIARVAAERGVHHSTLERVLTEQVAAHGGSSLRTFHMEHSDKAVGVACV